MWEGRRKRRRPLHSTGLCDVTPAPKSMQAGGEALTCGWSPAVAGVQSCDQLHLLLDGLTKQGLQCASLLQAQAP